VLTCNWHNWKFDLESGVTLVGGDPLRRYPVQVRDDEVWIDVADPPAAARQEAALASRRPAACRWRRWRGPSSGPMTTSNMA
jgi:phenylpropionate dioxygenase-like ring-hydroxylating dioxygenase large terminal subunit